MLMLTSIYDDGGRVLHLGSPCRDSMAQPVAKVLECQVMQVAAKTIYELEAKRILVVRGSSMERVLQHRPADSTRDLRSLLRRGQEAELRRAARWHMGTGFLSRPSDLPVL